MSDKTFFQDKWLEDQAFGDWLRRDKDRNRAQCLACAKTFSLGNGYLCRKITCNEKRETPRKRSKTS